MMPLARWAIIPNAQLPPMTEPSMAAISIARPVIAGATKYIIAVSKAVPKTPPMIARLILITACSSLRSLLRSALPRTESARDLVSDQRNTKAVVERRSMRHPCPLERRSRDANVGKHEVAGLVRDEPAFRQRQCQRPLRHHEVTRRVPGRRIDARWNVECEDRCAAVNRPSDEVGCRPRWSRLQSVADERINDEIRRLPLEIPDADL